MLETKYLVSIIIPIYNVEHYLEKCVRSVLVQTYANIEILLIDDGSTDNSFNVCRKLKNDDDRINVLKKENGGVSSARNYGLEHCNGDFITFVDADDWVDKKYIECLLDGITSSSRVDMVTVGRNEWYDRNKIVQRKLLNENESDIYNKLKVLNKAMDKEKTWVGFVWGKLYKMSIINAYHIRFDEKIILGEDMLFSLTYVTHIKECKVIDKPLYYYWIRENSATGNSYYDIKAEESKLKSIALCKKIAIEQNAAKLVERASINEYRTMLWILCLKEKNRILIKKEIKKFDTLFFTSRRYLSVKDCFKYLIFKISPSFLMHIMDDRNKRV